jgi:hypothetical protein
VNLRSSIVRIGTNALSSSARCRVLDVPAVRRLRLRRVRASCLGCMARNASDRRYSFNCASHPFRLGLPPCCRDHHASFRPHRRLLFQLEGTVVPYFTLGQSVSKRDAASLSSAAPDGVRIFRFFLRSASYDASQSCPSKCAAQLGGQSVHHRSVTNCDRSMWGLAYNGSQTHVAKSVQVSRKNGKSN